MRTIQKGPQPACLVTYQADPAADFESISGACKDAVRDALVRDQGGVCCFCMDRIRPGRFEMKVAHMHSQTGHEDRALRYANLFGACLGGQGKVRKFQHCDTYQGNQDLHTRLDHPTLRLEAVVRYDRDGRISAPSNTVLDREIDDVLNLNEDGLCRKRRDVLNGLLGALRHLKGAWSKALLDQKRREWESPGPDGYRPFYGVVLYYLDRRQ